MRWRAIFLGGLLAGLAAAVSPTWAGPPAICGDGEITPPETCDDGNTDNTDACSYPSCFVIDCPDGITNRDVGEECDDGNTIDDDDCSNTCQSNCGNGVPNGTEQCDDGNTVNGDGCENDCYFIAPDGCGDGIITPPEACDDGNTATDPTGATDTCSFPSCLPVVCGDGITNPDVGEQCDDQNTVDDDDCTNGCQSNCGNGVPNGTEQCDDGNTIDGDGCENDCSFTSFPVPPEIPCIAAANQNLAGVAKAEAGDAAACVKAIASGKDSAAGCLYLDAKGKVAKAQAKTIATFGGKKCDGVLPGVAVTDPTTVNAAGSEQTQNGVRAILGDPPPLATKDADKSGAACQAEALKQYGAVLGKYYAEAVKAKKAALKGGKGGTPPPADSGPELASALDTALGASQPLAKAGSKAAASIAKKCADGQVDALFDCNGAATASALAQCVVGAAKEAGCQALSLGDAIDMTCPTEL